MKLSPTFFNFVHKIGIVGEKKKKRKRREMSSYYLAGTRYVQ